MRKTELSMLGLQKRHMTALEKKDITFVEKLLSWAPLRYIDNSKETGLDPSLSGCHAVIIGDMTECSAEKASSGRKYISIKVIEHFTGLRLRIAIFGQLFMLKQYLFMKDRPVIVAGKLNYDDRYGYSMTNPDLISATINENMRIVPVFSKIAGMSSDKVVENIHKAVLIPPDDLIEDIARQEQLVSLSDAYMQVMFPDSMKEVDEARKRLLFNDLFYLAARFTVSERSFRKDGILIRSAALADECIKDLPYTLTNGQMNTYLGIKDAMMNGDHLRALVQGDVSCGKTEVAFLSMLLAAGNGFQAALMAPTQILAEQHYEKLCKKVEGKGIRVVYLGGGKVSKDTLRALESGEALLAVGTHALLSSRVQFKNLGLIVIDEEHKFGVQQRNAIAEKAAVVDAISMTSTPMPRTLANAVFGSNTRVYSIHELPRSRKPVITYYDKGRRVAPFLKKVLDSGCQAYVVCPMIDEAEEGSLMSNVLSTHEAFELYNGIFGSDYVIKELTGATPPDETEEILRDFRDGKVHMLVSTTVIEVGVDVPNAAAIVIHNAERFGLAGLHQLRGRVGRGSRQSYCILVSQDTPEENGRLRTILDTTDGFKIAEEDMLHLRKSGDLFGEEQSGFNRFVEEMIRNPDLYETCLRHAKTCDTDLLLQYIDFASEMENTKIRRRRNET